MRKSDTFLAILFVLSMAAATACGIVSASGMASDVPVRALDLNPQIEPKPVQKKSAPRNLAIFIFDGVQIIDYTGPYEVFGHAWDNDQPLFNIYTVAEKADPITTNMGMTVVPKYTFDNAPKPDIILLPGGGVNKHLKNPNVIKWVQERAQIASQTASLTRAGAASTWR